MNKNAILEEKINDIKNQTMDEDFWREAGTSIIVLVGNKNGDSYATFGSFNEEEAIGMLMDFVADRMVAKADPENGRRELDIISKAMSLTLYEVIMGKYDSNNAKRRQR